MTQPKSRAVASRASPEVIIHTIGNLAPAEAQENRMKRKVVLAEETGEANQTVPTSKVADSKMACHNLRLQRKLTMSRKRLLLSPRRRKRLRKKSNLNQKKRK